MVDGQVLQLLPRMSISGLPDELLAEIFDLYRLVDEYGWNYRRQWYNLLQVCRRWRYIMLGSATSLKLCFLCDFAKPIATIPSHLTPIPLIIRFDFDPIDPPHFKQDFLLALQHIDHVRTISIGNWCYGDLELQKALDKTFPALENLSLSLFGDKETGLFSHGRPHNLPHDFVGPHLRALHLRNITIPRESLLLSKATNLLSLRLESIRASGYFPPEYLVDHMACMTHLEDISIMFHPSFYLPDTETELMDTWIPRVVLPRLSRLIYRGPNAFMESLLNRISTPFLRDFRIKPRLAGHLTTYSLPAFLGTIQNLNIRTAVVTFFPACVDITYVSDQSSVVLPYLTFSFSSPSVATSAVQLCNVIAPALPVVENLELVANYNPSSCWEYSQVQPEPALWHALLRSFGGVKTLGVDMSVELATELSDALDPSNGAVIKELLPVLSEVVVLSKEGPADESFSSFIHARRFSGHSIDLRVIQDRPIFWQAPPISWTFDTFHVPSHHY